MPVAMVPRTPYCSTPPCMMQHPQCTREAWTPCRAGERKRKPGRQLLQRPKYVDMPVCLTHGELARLGKRCAYQRPPHCIAYSQFHHLGRSALARIICEAPKHIWTPISNHPPPHSPSAATLHPFAPTSKPIAASSLTFLRPCLSIHTSLAGQVRKKGI